MLCKKCGPIHNLSIACLNNLHYGPNSNVNFEEYLYKHILSSQIIRPIILTENFQNFPPAMIIPPFTFYLHLSCASAADWPLCVWSRRTRRSTPPKCVNKSNSANSTPPFLWKATLAWGWNTFPCPRGCFFIWAGWEVVRIFFPTGVVGFSFSRGGGGFFYGFLWGAICRGISSQRILIRSGRPIFRAYTTLPSYFLSVENFQEYYRRERVSLPLSLPMF